VVTVLGENVHLSYMGVGFQMTTNGPSLQLSLAERRRRVLELKRRHWRNWKIARELGVTERTVERDLRWLADRHVEELDKDIAEHRRRELDLLYSVNEEAWKAWDKSKEAYEKEQASSEQRESANGISTRSRVQTTRETTPGDPRYLQAILDGVEKRAKLLGLYKRDGEERAPQYSQQMLQVVISTMTTDQLRAIVAAYEHMRDGGSPRRSIGSAAAGTGAGSSGGSGHLGADGGPDPFGPDPIPLCDLGRLSAGLDPVDLQSPDQGGVLQGLHGEREDGGGGAGGLPMD
jgi:hypothetical protein